MSVASENVRNFSYNNNNNDNTRSSIASLTYMSRYALQIGISLQWRRQDLLREGAKLLIWSWGTHDELHGRVQQLLDD